jgi:predicted dehydrogenase
MITSNFGLPQQVYCVTGNNAPDKQQRLYLTEDSAIITLKFSDVLSGALLAGKAANSFGQEPQKFLIAQNQVSTLRIDDNHFEVAESQGKILRQDDFNDDNLGRLKRTIENFGSNLLWPDTNPLVSTAQESLKNMAVIEAAYLSARTGMPEEPEKILKIA